MTQKSACTGCGAPLIWAYTANGHRMPLDAEPVEPTISGTYVFCDATHVRIAQPLLDGPEMLRYMPHFATCPVAERFRKENQN